VLAAREDVSAAFRLLLEDLGHYGVARKDRDDQGMTVDLEEFSAVSGGARGAIDLAERLLLFCNDRLEGAGVPFLIPWAKIALLAAASAAGSLAATAWPVRRRPGSGRRCAGIAD
jgi:hypothetical protein